MSDWMTPDYDKGKLVKFLRGLDTSHSVSLPEEIMSIVERHEAQLRDVANTRARWAEGATRKASEIQAVLDDDTPVAKGAHRCEASVPSRSSWTHSATCHNDAVVARTFQQYLGGANKPTQIFLCGTHRKVKGSYGFPF